ncbi:hypothetical protein HN011_005998 [Eciton burchellii]|nr:hypothetical protein HN011_005998 [Eciton burchellii]
MSSFVEHVRHSSSRLASCTNFGDRVVDGRSVREPLRFGKGNKEYGSPVKTALPSILPSQTGPSLTREGTQASSTADKVTPRKTPTGKGLAEGDRKLEGVPF